MVVNSWNDDTSKYAALNPQAHSRTQNESFHQEGIDMMKIAVSYTFLASLFDQAMNLGLWAYFLATTFQIYLMEKGGSRVTMILFFSFIDV